MDPHTLARFPRLDGIAARQRRALITDVIVWALLAAGLVLSVVAA